MNKEEQKKEDEKFLYILSDDSKRQKAIEQCEEMIAIYSKSSQKFLLAAFGSGIIWGLILLASIYNIGGIRGLIQIRNIFLWPAIGFFFIALIRFALSYRFEVDRKLLLLVDYLEKKSAK